MRSVDANNDGIADRAADTGMLDPDGEFLVQNFAQTGASFYGAEGEVVLALKPDEVDLRFFADYVCGKLNNGSDVPRITPPRFGRELNGRTGPWTANVTAMRVMQQNRVAELETSTPGYTLLNVGRVTASRKSDRTGSKSSFRAGICSRRNARTHFFPEEFCSTAGKSIGCRSKG